VLPVPTSKPDSDKKLASPFKLTDEHTISAIQPLSGGRLLYSQSSFTKPNDAYIIRKLDQLPASYDSWDNDTKDLKAESFTVSQLTRFTEGELKDKHLDGGEEFYFDGAERKIQGWILKPKGYSKNDKKKWAPLLLIHGGPQGAWGDGWSTRWNPNGTPLLQRRERPPRADQGIIVFAQQGYFVVAINPSGSTTFGQGIYLSDLLLSRMCLILLGFQTSRMPLRRIGEGSHLSISVRDGNISSITTLRSGPRLV
jgi:dipeptidyl aminopeptidase/acylaminoacyl peptidase